MLIFDLSGSSDVSADYDLIMKEASRIGLETLEMWNRVLAKAKEEVARHNESRTGKPRNSGINS
jgi:hypothetical protein